MLKNEVKARIITKIRVKIKVEVALSLFIIDFFWILNINKFILFINKMDKKINIKTLLIIKIYYYYKINQKIKNKK